MLLIVFNNVITNVFTFGVMMKSIVLLSSKGGVGKSSIIKHIHRELSRLGFSVWGKDTDPQGTYESFLNSISEPDYADYFLYDTQGADSVTNRTLLEAASQAENDCLIIVPVQPTKTDLERALSVAHLLHQFKVKDSSLTVEQVRQLSRDKQKEYANKLSQDWKVAKNSIEDMEHDELFQFIEANHNNGLLVRSGSVTIRVSVYEYALMQYITKEMKSRSLREAIIDLMQKELNM